MPTLKEDVMEFLKSQPDDVEAGKIIEFVVMKQILSKGEQNLQEGRSNARENGKDESYENEDLSSSKQILETILNCRLNFDLSPPIILKILGKNRDRDDDITVLSNILSSCENECHRYYRCDNIAKGDDILKELEDSSIN